MIKDRFRLTRLGLALLFVTTASYGAVIDGPANIRSAPNGVTVFSLLDMTVVDMGASKGQWIAIKLEIEQPPETIDKHRILPGRTLFCVAGVECGKAITAVAIDNAKLTAKGITTGTITGYTHTKNLKRIKLIVPQGFNVKDASYLAPSLVNEKRREYSIQDVWDSPPYAAEASVKRRGNKLHISVGDFHEAVIDFHVRANGVVDRPTCWSVMCVSEVVIPNDKKMFMIIHGVKYEFVNIKGMKEINQKVDEE